VQGRGELDEEDAIRAWSARGAVESEVEVCLRIQNFKNQEF
jgi:hypothetical protein